MTATALQTVPDTARLTAASALQKLLPELVALTLDAKQAHWNVTGPAFLPLHALTDEIAADTRTWVDRVAERAVALGFTVDARPRNSRRRRRPVPCRTGLRSRSDRRARRATSTTSPPRRAPSLADLEQADAVAHDLTVDGPRGAREVPLDAPRPSWLTRGATGRPLPMRCRRGRQHPAPWTNRSWR